MIEALGSLATGIGEAVSAPAIGGEVGSAVPSVITGAVAPVLLGGEIGMAVSNAGISGGSFAAGLNSASLFSETTPFFVSPASIPEMPLGNPSGVFSDSWSILAKTDAPVVSSTDVLSDLGFESFSPSITSVPEMPLKVDLSESQWLSLVGRPKEAESILGSVSVEPEGEVVEGMTDLQVNGLKTLTESSVADERAQILAEETIEQSKLAEKVVNLLVEEGVYSEAQARRRVGEITLEKKGLSTESVGEAVVEIRIEAEVGVEPATKTGVQRTKTDTKKTQVGARVEDKHLSKNSWEKIPEQAVVVDEKAQANRKKTAREIISTLFERAKKVGFQKVDSRVITEALRKKQEHKSLLLAQLKIPHVTDGSLEEAAGAIEFLGELGVLSESDEGKMTDRIDMILERNVPVKIANLTSQEVSEKDVKRVLKYAGVQVVLA